MAALSEESLMVVRVLQKVIRASTERTFAIKEGCVSVVLVPATLRLSRPRSLNTYNLGPLCTGSTVFLHVVLIFNEYYKTLARSTERRIINSPPPP